MATDNGRKAIQALFLVLLAQNGIQGVLAMTIPASAAAQAGSVATTTLSSPGLPSASAPAPTAAPEVDDTKLQFNLPFPIPYPMASVISWTIAPKVTFDFSETHEQDDTDLQNSSSGKEFPPGHPAPNQWLDEDPRTGPSLLDSLGGGPLESSVDASPERTRFHAAEVAQAHRPAGRRASDDSAPFVPRVIEELGKLKHLLNDPGPGQFGHTPGPQDKWTKPGPGVDTMQEADLAVGQPARDDRDRDVNLVEPVADTTLGEYEDGWKTTSGGSSTYSDEFDTAGGFGYQGFPLHEAAKAKRIWDYLRERWVAVGGHDFDVDEVDPSTVDMALFEAFVDEDTGAYVPWPVAKEMVDVAVPAVLAAFAAPANNGANGANETPWPEAVPRSVTKHVLDELAELDEEFASTGPGVPGVPGIPGKVLEVHKVYATTEYVPPSHVPTTFQTLVRPRRSSSSSSSSSSAGTVAHVTAAPVLPRQVIGGDYLSWSALVSATTSMTSSGWVDAYEDRGSWRTRIANDPMLEKGLKDAERYREKHSGEAPTPWFDDPDRTPEENQAIRDELERTEQEFQDEIPSMDEGMKELQDETHDRVADELKYGIPIGEDDYGLGGDFS